MKKLNSKGEGPLIPVLIIVILAGLAYAGYVYLWPMLSGPSSQPSLAQVTPTPGEAKAGSMAGAAVQGAQAAGDLLSSGR
jgi:flagellar basal body-associated protein FliL